MRILPFTLACLCLSLVSHADEALAQDRAPQPSVSGAPTTGPRTAEGRETDPVAGVWSARPRREMPCPDASSELPWPESGPSTGVSVRGVQWISQDRGAVYYQPGERIRVRVKWNSTTAISGMRVSRDLTTQFPLYDDGTHGDAIGGDGIWSSDSISVYSYTGSAGYKLAKDSKYGSAITSWLTVEWRVGTGAWENDGYAYVRVGVVDPLCTMDVMKVATGMWATEYACFIEDSLQSQRTLPGYPMTASTWSYLMKPATNAFFAHFADAFDFVVVTPGTPVWIPGDLLSERVPNAAAVRNAVTGIGMSAFNLTAEYGSAGRMQTIVYHSYGPFNILSHELGHRWMAYLDSLTFSNGACGVHWAENQTVGGNMSLWPKLVETSPGVFKGVVSHTPDAFNASYSDLDLYLMGLKPASALPTIKRLNGANYTNPDSVRFTSITTMTPTALQARFGTRTPSSTAAQHDFTMATIVLKPLGWTDAEFAYFSLLARHAADTLDDGYGYNYCFEKAAKGTATLDGRLGSPSGMPAVPVLVSPADNATGQPASITLTWSAAIRSATYQVQLSRRNDFTDTVITKSGVTGTSITSSGLRPATVYYWRVRAVGTGGSSAYSLPRSFATASGPTDVPVGEGRPSAFALSPGFPNPFNPSTRIQFSVPVQSEVRLEVYSPLGQRIAILHHGLVDAGIYLAMFTPGVLASGTYYVRMYAVPVDGTPNGPVLLTRAVTLVK